MVGDRIMRLVKIIRISKANGMTSPLTLTHTLDGLSHGTYHCYMFPYQETAEPMADCRQSCPGNDSATASVRVEPPRNHPLPSEDDRFQERFKKRTKCTKINQFIFLCYFVQTGIMNFLPVLMPLD